MTLRANLIRLAHEKPELRDHILPILKSASGEGDLQKELDAQGRAIIQKDLDPLGKNAWWKPPHNLALNFALMGANFWSFTILPFAWKRKAYRADLGGIVIQPIWSSVDDGRGVGVMDMSGFYNLTPEIAEKIVSVITRAPTIHETVTKELKAIEQVFGIDIPNGVRSKLILEATKVAKRRWGVNRMRVKNRLIPLDGSKPRDLGSFD